MQGRTIAGKYQLVEKLREHRFYDLYIAYSENSGKQMLLKIIRPELTTESTFSNLNADLSVVASLRHNGVSALRDFGLDGDMIYLVEDYFDGAPLSQVISRAGAVNAYQTLNQGIKIVDAIGAAHARGVMHGLLSPESIFIGGDLSIKVADFYYLFALSNELTSAKEFQGRDILYCAPEVVAGRKPTMASDVYSMGVILYELLTGRPPFDRDSALSVALNKEQKRPRSPRELNQDIPRLLDTVIMKCLRVDPEARYQDARRLVSELHLCRSSLARSMAEEGGMEPAAVSKPVEDPDLVNVGGWLKQNDESRMAGMPQQQSGKSFWRDENRVDEEEVEELQSGTKKQLPQGFTLFMGSLFVLLAILFFGFTFIKNNFIGGGRTGVNVVVPDVTNKSVVEAKALLSQVGLVPVEEKPQFSKAIPSGLIMQQDPPAGSTVRAGREVLLTPSAGEEKIEVPRLVGLTADEARILIEKEGFEVGDEREEYDADVEKGFVIDQTPEAGRETYPGQRIMLVISKGSAPRLINMPRVTDLSLGDAKSILAMNEIVNVKVQKIASGGQAGFVASQSVLEGARIAPDQEVILYVADPPKNVVFNEVKGVVNLKISTEEPSQEVVIVVFDQDGSREVYRKTHKPDDMVKVPVSGFGTTNIKVFLDGQLAKEQTL